MSSHDTHTRDDAEFDLFLERSGELSQQLQSLPQPEPSAELDAAILAQAEKNLAAGSRPPHEASNDAFIPDARPGRPTFFRRMQVPMGLAASVMVAVLVTLQWEARSPDDIPVLVAQAPQAEEWSESRSVAKRPPSTSAASATAPSPAPEADASALNRQESAKQGEAERFRIAQAEMAERERRASRSAAPVDSASTPAPPMSKLIKIPPAHEAKPWLALIEELWKADLPLEAVEEWKRFQKSYPDYPVPEKLKKALNEAAKEQTAR